MLNVSVRLTHDAPWVCNTLVSGSDAWLRVQALLRGHRIVALQRVHNSKVEKAFESQRGKLKGADEATEWLFHGSRRATDTILESGYDC